MELTESVCERDWSYGCKSNNAVVSQCEVLEGEGNPRSRMHHWVGGLGKDLTHDCLFNSRERTMSF